MTEVPAGVGVGVVNGPTLGVRIVLVATGVGVGVEGVCAAPCTHALPAANAASNKILVMTFSLLGLNNCN